MASAADSPLQKIPREMAKQLLVTDTRLKNSLSHPMYKLWWRKINDHAGQEFMIKNLEEKEDGEKDAKEHAKKLPELKEMVEAKITKLEEELATLQGIINLNFPLFYLLNEEI